MQSCAERLVFLLTGHVWHPTPSQWFCFLCGKLFWHGRSLQLRNSRNIWVCNIKLSFRVCHLNEILTFWTVISDKSYLNGTSFSSHSNLHMPHFIFLSPCLQNEVEDVCGRHTLDFSLSLCSPGRRVSDSFATIHSVLMPPYVMIDTASQCWVLYFSEATFISTLGHIYFQDLETGSFHLGVAGEKHGEDLMENENNRLE